MIGATNIMTMNTGAVDAAAEAGPAGAVAGAVVTENKTPDTPDKPDLRKQILEIQRNPNLTPKERTKMIFTLFNKNKNATKTQQSHHHHTDPCEEYRHRCCAAGSDSPNADGAGTGDGESTSHDMRETVKSMLRNMPIAQENIILSPGGARITIPCSQLGFGSEDGRTEGCAHYDRNCSMYAECCGKFYPCRLCHDKDNGDHSLDRKKVKVVRCRKCLLIQLAGPSCRNTNCGIRFAEYHCGRCNLWLTPPAETPDMNVYHCEKCDVCLIGRPGIDAAHCDECGFCMPLDKYNSHTCKAISPDEICGICREGFETLAQAEKTKCGHVFHLTCMESYMHHDISCPICKRTLFDMSRTWEQVDIQRAAEILPEEYRNWRVTFICNDCQSFSEDRISFIGNRCGSCNSYNTSQQDLIKDT